MFWTSVILPWTFDRKRHVLLFKWLSDTSTSTNVNHSSRSYRVYVRFRFSAFLPTCWFDHGGSPHRHRENLNLDADNNSSSGSIGEPGSCEAGTHANKSAYGITVKSAPMRSPHLRLKICTAKMRLVSRNKTTCRYKKLEMNPNVYK